ncbi:helix-turn-helix domain-containing protein [Streptomyces sp. NPDC048295]|uniref:helix-turn-helix domain-containing protein n=1 Tax=Streptomyces sp. NPDC048295 TaxID=3154617 RepID=UPI003418CA28
MANAIGALLGAPITIEDQDSQVLAFPGGQDEADRTRIQTILGRGVPQHARHAQHGTFLLDALSAWLDGQGNVLSASASLDVHPNTFRYRLRRAAEIAGMDLNDAEARFAAMLELRLGRAVPP